MRLRSQKFTIRIVLTGTSSKWERFIGTLSISEPNNGLRWHASRIRCYGNSTGCAALQQIGNPCRTNPQTSNRYCHFILLKGHRTSDARGLFFPTTKLFDKCVKTFTNRKKEIAVPNRPKLAVKYLFSSQHTALKIATVISAFSSIVFKTQLWTQPDWAATYS